ncbi:DUF4267 domain-containing protein [Streptantibioticus rubrisoli]|uniref:DUF4267 domain-containing protein n=1 Tax=Streptantibioticus rubrisoli TaxID=1387313 RepID=A0ABT1P799_9ACTN|nr:DUF4267 domain-containing protein [Streptantibioticus rubrisoli]MCQ4041254.1 DUF4267 domain-containing protein [Streptantibioticus rubrisoli]
MTRSSSRLGEVAGGCGDQPAAFCPFALSAPLYCQGNASGYFIVKGVRDVAVASTVFLLLALGQRRTLG